MFSFNDYPFDLQHGAFEVGGETMVLHCHHYMTYLQRSILDADYIDSRPFLIGAAADAAYHQLKALSDGMTQEEKVVLACEIYAKSGYGLISFNRVGSDGGEVVTTSSVYSSMWLEKFGPSKKPVDYFTSGYLAAAFAVIHGVDLRSAVVEQTACMAAGNTQNVHQLRRGASNFSHHSAKRPTEFIERNGRDTVPWEHHQVVTDAFVGAHATLVGNAQGLIPAFGVKIARNYSDYVNRLQVEFILAMQEKAGMYGVTLGSELMLEAGHACGFFTYGGIMTSNEWNTVVAPYLKTKEDWIYGLLSLINTMGWGYHTAVKLSKEYSIFRNYNDFESLSHLRMYGKSEYPVSWANSGGFTGLCQLIYRTGLTEGSVIDTEEGFHAMRRHEKPYKTEMVKSRSAGDAYLEVHIYE